MSYVGQVLDSYPRTVNVDASVLAAAIERSATVQPCTADTDADLSEQNLAELVNPGRTVCRGAAWITARTGQMAFC